MIQNEGKPADYFFKPFLWALNFSVWGGGKWLDSAGLWVFFDALQVCFPGLCSYGFCHMSGGCLHWSVTTGIQENAIPAPTLVLLNCRVPAHRDRWFPGKLGPNTSYWLSAQMTSIIVLSALIHCSAFLATSLDGNRSEAQKIWSCM